MAIKVYGATDLIGGGTGAIDRAELDGNNLNDLDIMLFNNATVFSPYTFDAGNATAESSPDNIAPDTNPAAGRWLMIGIRGAYLQADNIKIDGNTISSLDANGDVKVAPNGTGRFKVDVGSSNTGIRIETTGIGVLEFSASGTGRWQIQKNSDNDFIIKDVEAANVVTIKDGASANSIYVDSSGNIGHGTPSFGASAAGVLALGNGIQGAAAADMVQLVAKDWNGAGTSALHIMTEEGTEHVFGNNVGIGVITSASGLDEALVVVGTIKAMDSFSSGSIYNTGKIQLANASSNQNFTIDHNVGTGTTTFANNLSADATALVFKPRNGVETIRIVGTGNIKISNGTLAAAAANSVQIASQDFAATDARLYIQGESGNYIIIGGSNIIPQTDGTGECGTVANSWADVNSVLINGADICLDNDWRMLEAEDYGYPSGWALDRNISWRTPDILKGRNVGVGDRVFPEGSKPVFAVTEDFIEYKGTRITKEMLDKLLALI